MTGTAKRPNATPPSAASASNEIALIDTKAENALARIENISQTYAIEASRIGLRQLALAVITAKSIGMLRAALTNEVMDLFMPLMNTHLGFKTDRTGTGGRPPYSKEEVREVLVAAALQDCPFVGNHFNIISGQLYITKEGYERKVGGIAGLTDLEFIPSPPFVRDGQTLVKCVVRWKLNGLPQQLLDSEGKPGRTIVVPVTTHSGPDMIIGKAKRKALKAAWEQIMGSEHTIPEPEDETPAEKQLAAAATSAPAVIAQAERAASANGTHRTDDGELASSATLDAINDEARRCGLTDAEVQRLLASKGIPNLTHVTRTQAEIILAELRELPDAREAGEEG